MRGIRWFSMLAALMLVSPADAQVAPQILNIQTGCFLRGGSPFNLLVRVGPYYTTYHFMLTRAGSNQMAVDVTYPMIAAGGEVPLRIPSGGTYHLSVGYAPTSNNNAVTSSSYNIVVSAVRIVTISGVRRCQRVLSVYRERPLRVR